MFEMSPAYSIFLKIYIPVDWNGRYETPAESECLKWKSTFIFYTLSKKYTI
jgi:hypothetical protein